MSLSNEWPQRGATLRVLDVVSALCHSEVTPLVVSDGRTSAGAWDVVSRDLGAGHRVVAQVLRRVGAVF